jgi:hypothetical protein
VPAAVHHHGLGAATDPPFGSSESRVVNFYSAHATQGYVYQFIAGIAMLSALWFVGYLYTRFRREVPDSPLPVVMLASGVAWIAFVIVYLGLFQVFSVWAQQPATQPLLRAFSDAYVLGFMFSVIPAAVMITAAALCVRHSPGWPGWLKPLAVLVVATQALGCVPLLAPASALRAGGLITYASVFTAVLWICLASIAAVRSELARARAREPREEAYSRV